MVMAASRGRATGGGTGSTFHCISWLCGLLLAANNIDAAGQQHKRLYELLEVEPTATEQQIKKAYRKRSMTWHPDKNPGNEEEAQAKFIEIGNAFETLSDTQSRQQYDRHGIDKQTQQSKGGASNNFQNFHRRFEEQMRQNGHFNFESFFNSRDAKPKTCDRVIEGRSLSLGCEHSGSNIEKVEFASYGVPSGKCDGGGGGGFAAGECNSPNTREVSHHCNGGVIFLRFMHACLCFRPCCFCSDGLLTY
jgi:DnaJ-class molecular chaperone